MNRPEHSFSPTPNRAPAGTKRWNRNTHSLRTHTAALVCLAAVSVISSLAADPPPEQFVAKPAPFAHWKISAKTGKSASPASPDALQITDIEFQKGAQTAGMVQNWNNGKSVEAWITRGYHLAKYPAFPDIYITSLSMRSEGLNDGMDDFHAMYPGVFWVAKKFLAGTEKKDGKSCHHFVDAENQREAWIEEETRLPVAYRKENTEFFYTFLPSLAQDPVFPPRFQRQLDALLKAEGR